MLKEYGIEDVMGDIDVNNFPMEQALIRIGYKFRKHELVMKRDVKYPHLYKIGDFHTKKVK